MPPTKLTDSIIADIGTSSPLLAELSDRLRAEQSVSLWFTGSTKTAARVLRRLKNPDSIEAWPIALRHNLAFVQSRTAGELKVKLGEYTEAGVPEALFNLALATEAAGGSGELSLPLLEQFLSTVSSHPLAPRVKALVALKKALYR